MVVVVVFRNSGTSICRRVNDNVLLYSVYMMSIVYGYAGAEAFLGCKHTRSSLPSIVTICGSYMKALCVPRGYFASSLSSYNILMVWLA